MAHYKVQISWPLDSALPRDRVAITPHYFGDNPGALANALKANLLAARVGGATIPWELRVYDAQKAPPSYPLATASNPGTTPISSYPREVCLVLSCYSSYNRPRYRGRVYIPPMYITAARGARPTAQQISDALDWGGILGRNLPSQHNWEVWSPTDQTGRTISDYWVDDEWDIVRTRGLRGTTRQTGKIP